MNFYEYNQNNSGGHFDVDNEVTVEVFIEAPSAERANAIAESVGIYFDGCDDGRDCECCGDRWSRASTWNVVEQDKLEETNTNSGWVKPGQAWRHIYFADGTKKSLIR